MGAHHKTQPKTLLFKISVVLIVLVIANIVVWTAAIY